MLDGKLGGSVQLRRTTATKLFGRPERPRSASACARARNVWYIRRGGFAYLYAPGRHAPAWLVWADPAKDSGLGERVQDSLEERPQLQ